MHKEIKKVEIILENCEVITVNRKHIGDFCCKNISYSIKRMACNSISEMRTCETFIISINRNCSLNQNLELTMATVDGMTRDPLKRLMEYPDITALCIYFTDDEDNSDEIYVKWNGDEYNNKYQKTYMNEFGDVFIVIDKDLKLEDVFDMNKIENIDDMYHKWNTLK